MTTGLSARLATVTTGAAQRARGQAGDTTGVDREPNGADMPEWIKEQLKEAARELLSRPSALRGPFFVSDKKLRKILNEK